MSTEAEDAGLEGRFTVDVWIEKTGEISEVEIPKKVGFGMDKIIINSLLGSTCKVKRNKKGEPKASWHSIQIELQLD